MVSSYLLASYGQQYLIFEKRVLMPTALASHWLKDLQIVGLSREPRKRRPKRARIAPPRRLNLALCLRLASIYKDESWQRAVTLGDSTPQ
jgi:hypothetical protein